MGGMSMGDEPGSISVKAGTSKSRKFTFAKAGRYEIGCHIPGPDPWREGLDASDRSASCLRDIVPIMLPIIHIIMSGQSRKMANGQSEPIPVPSASVTITAAPTR